MSVQSTFKVERQGEDMSDVEEGVRMLDAPTTTTDDVDSEFVYLVEEVSIEHLHIWQWQWPLIFLCQQLQKVLVELKKSVYYVNKMSS